MLLSEVADAAREVARVSSRREKIVLISRLLKKCEADEIEVVVGLLTGELRQGKFGVGWAQLGAFAAAGAVSGGLSILDLDRLISTIQSIRGEGSVEARRQILSELFRNATEAEVDFVRRVVIGDLRQGALGGLMAEAVAAAAGVPAALVRRAAMLSGDLRKTATLALTTGRSALEGIRLSIFTPVMPMLASTSESIEDALEQTGDASVEWKLDGVRVQVHKRDDQVRVYSRNLNDLTERVPEIVRIARRLPTRSFVLDGEAIGLDADGRPFVFQEVMSGMGSVRANTFRTAVYFFDCLHSAGSDLIDEPLSKRFEILEDVARETMIPAIVTSSNEIASGWLRDSLAAGHEGVMVKDLTSSYQAGRRGKAWRKVKPIKTLDLVVLAAEWGHGRRKGWLSNLHLGAKGPGEFVMVGKTFKGLTDQLLDWQTEKLLEIETHREGITVFVRPELVVEIELDGVQTSTRYAGGAALRFARVRRFREDKRAEEADTIETVLSMR